MHTKMKGRKRESKKNGDKCDLDLQPTQANVSNGTTTPQEEHVCKTILKSIPKCRYYGPDKLIHDHFIILSFDPQV